MRGVGKALFSGSRFVRWTVVPSVIICGLTPPLLEQHWTAAFAWKLAVIEVCLVLLVLAVGWPVRFRWAGRVLGAVVFVGAAALLVDDLREQAAGDPKSNVVGGVRLFVVFGLPSLWYAVRGRFGFGENEPSRPPATLRGELPVLPEKDAPHEPH